jgi:hypothetical protein
MTARPTILTTIRAPLQKVNERERDVLSRWANSQGWNVLTRCGWSFGHSRAPQSLRLCASAVILPSPSSPLRAKNVLCGQFSALTTRARAQKGKRKGEKRPGSRLQEHPTGLFNNA